MNFIKEIIRGWTNKELLPEQPVVPDAIPFQNDIDEILEELPSPFIGGTFYIVVVMFLISVVLSAIVKVDVVVTASGRLTTDTPPILLQPMDRGIIRQMNVTAGSVVTKGQVLATLDPTFAKADQEALVTQHSTLLSQIRRLENELASKPFKILSDTSLDDQLQMSLYQQRQQQYASRLRMFDEEVQRLKVSITTIEDNRISLANQLKVIKEVEEIRNNLLQSKTGSKLLYLESQSNRMRIEREFQDAVNRLKELKHAVDSKLAERQTFIDEWRRQLVENLVTVRTEATKINQMLTKASMLRDMVVVTAPEDGVVLEVAKRTVGSIVRDGEPLITITPANAVLIAEINIGSGDVGYTKAGDEMVIKVDAFPYQRHGMLAGRLLSISEESYSANTPTLGQEALQSMGKSPSTAFHKGRVELTKTELMDLKEGFGLIPGMTMTAEIKVGARSVLAFFINPITRGLSESIREPP